MENDCLIGFLNIVYYRIQERPTPPPPPLPLFLDQTETRRSKKNYLRPSPPLSQGLDNVMLTASLRKGGSDPQVVYHLYTVQTGRFTVWVKGKQNSGLVNFVPESCLHLHLHLTRSHGDRWGATNLATLSLHLISILFSDFLRASRNFNPVH